MKIPLVAFLLVLAACAGTELSASSYDQRCTRDGDCTPVYQGDACAPCGCANAGINSAAVAQYEQELLRLRSRCGPTPATACKSCTPMHGLCNNARCTLRPE